MAEINSYVLHRKFFDFCFEKKECKAAHAGLYCYIVEQNNRYGWKKEFGLPTDVTVEALSIGNRNTFLKLLRDLVEWGFIIIVKESMNQNQSRVISLCLSRNDKTVTTALDKALIMQSNEQYIDKDMSNDTIVKQLNHKPQKTIKPFIFIKDKSIKSIINEESKWLDKVSLDVKINISTVLLYFEEFIKEQITDDKANVEKSYFRRWIKFKKVNSGGKTGLKSNNTALNKPLV